MKNKVKLEKRDFYRVLLTDVLPYEVPFFLTNEGFYNNLKKTNNKSLYGKLLDEVLFKPRVKANPFVFKIIKDDKSFRKLYLVHPNSQIRIVELYKSYNQLISHLCSRSSYSLRYPFRIAKSYYVPVAEDKKSLIDKYKDEDVEVDSNDNDEPIYASTFFKYKDVSFLYKFYDSYQFHRIEKKFNNLLKFDIAKCFDSISTFQLSRSIRDESGYDIVEAHSFEKKFEEIMRGSFNGNTHGIVIGPEFSRIFAEILMQSIDMSVKIKIKNMEIKNKNGMVEGVDYVVKRYVDDFFLFYNNEEVANIVFSVICEELSNYRLYCNESKSQKSHVPFITGITLAKHEIKARLESFFTNFDLLVCNDSKINYKLNGYYKISNQLISDMKCIVYKSDISYSSVSGYFFTLMKIHVLDIKNKFSEIKECSFKIDGLNKIFLIILDVIFFMYSMSFKVRSTYLLSQILIFICSVSEDMGDEYSDVVFKKIYDEIGFIIKFKVGNNILNSVEILNLLIAVRDIDLDYQILPEDLIAHFSDDDISNYTYFSLMTFLFYVQRKRKYQSIRDKIYIIITRKLSHQHLNIVNDSELVHIFFDSISCPYLTSNQKINIAKLGLKNIMKLTAEEVGNIVNEISDTSWFIDWELDNKGAIERLLMKKELKSPYEN